MSTRPLYWSLLLLAPTVLAAEPPPDVQAILREVVAAHNRERAEHSLGPVALETRLTKAAEAHARDMAAHGEMSHEGSDKSSPFDRIKRAAYAYQSAAENVAKGQMTVEDVMRDWMNSPHHRENILGKYAEIGVGVAKSEEGQLYWCVDFGTPWPKLDPVAARGQLLDALNAGRKAAGLAALAADPKLDTVAAAQATSMAQHAEPGKPAPGQESLTARLKDAGYAFEALTQLGSYGQATPAEVAKTWLDGKEYRDLVLGGYGDAGIGYFSAPDGRPYWALLLAKPAR